MAHSTNKIQLQVVAVLALIVLFTHNPLFWIAALLLAMIELPNFIAPISFMAKSLNRIARSTQSLQPYAPVRTQQTTNMAAGTPQPSARQEESVNAAVTVQATETKDESSVHHSDLNRETK